MIKSTSSFVALLLIGFSCFASPHQPKLVVQIVVDQLRGDLIEHHKYQFGANGFNYLINNAIDFHNTHHPHANTTTCAGHATIATGSYPAMHGVIDNDWYDRASNKTVYCMEDLSAKTIPTLHTHHALPGRSPRNLKASTLSDEIVLAHKGKAFAVSLKDRAAITLAGHAGKAFWFDKSNGGFVTSQYYYSTYPHWVDEWNKQYKPKAYTWKLSHKKSFYENENTPVFTQKYKQFGQTFPHKIANPPSEEFFKFLSKTPKADALTADFAEHLLKEEQLGKSDRQTDYLAVSFSAVDAIGHQFGPNSLEAEENLIELDKTMAQFLGSIDREVGLDNTLIIVTADHGVSDSPAYLNSNNITEIEPIDTQSASNKVKAYLKNRYQLPEKTLLSINPPFVYLDHHIISQKHLSLAAVSQSVAELLSSQDGVFKAYPLPISNTEKDWITAKVDRMSYPYRSGDVYLVQPPFQSRGSASEERVNHGSPWRYDSYVPLLFVSPNFKPQTITRPVATTDIAPTLAAILMIKAPSAAVGEPLAEVLAQYH
jgi:predicted AlkP superfamily pyrophosphatase or phosphodiesterase